MESKIKSAIKMLKIASKQEQHAINACSQLRNSLKQILKANGNLRRKNSELKNEIETLVEERTKLTGEVTGKQIDDFVMREIIRLIKNKNKPLLESVLAELSEEVENS